MSLNGAPSLSLHNLSAADQLRLMEIGLQVLVERGLAVPGVAHLAQVFERAKVKAGRKGGLATSPAKAEAARENGRRGGRPLGHKLSAAQRRAMAKRMSDLWKAGKITSAKIERAKRRKAKATSGSAKAYKLTAAQRAKQRERNHRYTVRLRARLAEAERLAAEQQQGGGRAE